MQINNLIKIYFYVFPNIANAVNFYRLKMVDMDEKFKMDTVILINNTKLPKFAALLTNPAKDHISMLINNADKEKVTAALYNCVGQLIIRREPGKINGTISLPFNTNKPVAGIYNLRINNGEKTATFKISML